MKAQYSKIAIAIAATLYFFNYAKNYTEWHFIDGANLMIHEAGHVIFSFFGDFVRILGGSLNQVLIPLIFCSYFFLNRENFSASLVLFWVGQNLIAVSLYVGDSIKMVLPLLGGDGVIHDWHYLLSALGVLQYTDQIAGAIYGLGFLVIGIAAFFALKFSFEEKKPRVLVENF